MKILHLTQTPVARDPRVLKELEALAALDGAEILAFGAPASGPPPVEVEGIEIRHFDLLSVRLKRLPRPLRYTIVMAEINWRFLIAALKVRPDVIHCHDTMVLPSGVLAKIIGRAGSLVYDAHELESAKGGQSGALSLATLLTERLAWRSIDAFISVSPSILKWYHRNLDRDRAEKPALCLVNSPKVAELTGNLEAPLQHSLRDRIDIRSDVPLFVFVGALVRGRSIDLILRTFTNSMRQAHVAFIGYGSLEGEIRETSERHRNVHLVEPMAHDALVSFIGEADGAFCLIEDVSLSDRYCLPNKLFEYAFAGVPILASRLPDIEQLVTGYGLGFCVDMNEASVAQAVTQCINRHPPCLPKDMSEFSWDAQGENLRNFYLKFALPLDSRHSVEARRGDASELEC